MNGLPAGWDWGPIGTNITTNVGAGCYDSIQPPKFPIAISLSSPLTKAAKVAQALSNSLADRLPTSHIRTYVYPFLAAATRLCLTTDISGSQAVGLG